MTKEEFQVINEPNWIEQGWQCPVCKAVMSPKERVCVNCRGITLYNTTTFPETSQFYKPKGGKDK